MSDDAIIRPGSRLGPYVLGAELGMGATATVWLARDSSGREYALKVRRRGQDDLDRRFLREFESMRLLRVPGVVPVHEAGIEEKVLWFSMDRVFGVPFLEPFQPQPPGSSARVARAIDLGRKLCAVLAELHESGFVHRDIKPTNVLVDGNGEVNVLDFGIGRYFGDADTLSRTGEVLGTVPYMAPEQIAGLPTDERIDLFALGLMLHEAIAGARDRPPTTVGWIPKICLERLTPLASLFKEVPRGLSHLVDGLLSVDPDDRPSAREAALELQRISAGMESAEWPEPPFVDPGPWWTPLHACFGQGDGPPVAVLDGPTGSGRRRIAEQMHRMALLQGTWTVHLRCRVDRIGGPIFSLLETLLETLLARLDEREVNRVIGDAALPLRQMWPDLPIPLPRSSVDTPTTGKISRAIAGIIERVAEIHPLLLVLHDVEQIDPFTARLVPVLAGLAGENIGLLLLHESRWATPESKELLARVARESKATVLTVPRLSASVATAIVQGLVPAAPPEPFTRPIAASEAVEAGWAALARWRAEQWPAPTPSLWPLAVHERPIPAAVYAALAGTEATGSPYLRSDEAGVQPSGVTSFRVLRARLSRLGPSAATLAAAWEKLPPREEWSGDLATLWLLAQDRGKAWLPAASAAIRAERLELYPEARRWLLLLDTLPMPAPGTLSQDREFELAVVRARVALYTDALSVRPALVDSAEVHARTQDQENLIRLLRSEYTLRMGEARTALVGALRVGSSTSGAPPSLQVQALLLATRCRIVLGQIPEAIRDLDRAEALLGGPEKSRVTDPLLAVRASNARAEIALLQQELLWCRALSQQNIRSASQHRYVRGIAEAAHRLGQVLRMLGRRREAEHQIRSARDAVAETGDAVLGAETGLALATLLVERGEQLPARHLLDDTIRRIRGLSLEHLLGPCMRLALQIATQTGDTADATVAIAQINEVGPRDPETPAALVHWWRSRGDIERALAVVEPADRGYGHVAWQVERARAALAAGYVETGRKDLDVAIDRASELGFTELQTYALLVLGTVIDIEDETWAELQRRAARSMWTEVFLGALEMDARRLSRKDPVQARTRWRTLLERARELGYRPGVQEAEGWLLDERSS